MPIDFDKVPEFKKWQHDYRRAAAEVPANSSLQKFIKDTYTTISAMQVELIRLSEAVSDLNSRVP